MEEDNCPICLEPFRNPVSLTCGHNFCGICIDGHVNSRKKIVLPCPLCNRLFSTEHIHINGLLAKRLGNPEPNLTLNYGYSSNNDGDLLAKIQEDPRQVYLCIKAALFLAKISWFFSVFLLGCFVMLNRWYLLHMLTITGALGIKEPWNYVLVGLFLVTGGFSIVEIILAIVLFAFKTASAYIVVLNMEMNTCKTTFGFTY